MSFFRDEISRNFNLIREKARVCSLNLRNSVCARACVRVRVRVSVCLMGEESVREGEKWSVANRFYPGELARGSILIRVFVDTFKSGLAARRYACQCTRDPSRSSMTSLLAALKPMTNMAR